MLGNPSTKATIGGLVCLLCMLGVWETMGVVLQGFTSSYPKYTFITWFLHVGYIGPGLFWLLLRVITGRPTLARITRPIVLTALLASGLSFIASYCWYLSLSLTLLAANNAIYQSTPFFVFILSIFILKEKATLLKVSAFCLCAAGIALVAVSTPSENTDGHIQKSVWWGYVIELVSCLAYALYEVLYAKYGPKDEEGTEADGPLMKGALFLGVVGLWTLFCLWVIVLLAHVTGYETFEMPSEEQWRFLGINMTLETFFNVFLLSGIGLVGPVFMAVGGIIIIPIGILVDFERNHTLLTVNSIIGVCLIVTGFLMLEGPHGVRACANHSKDANDDNDDTLPLLVKEGVSPTTCNN